MTPEFNGKITTAIQEALLAELGPEGSESFKSSEKGYWVVVKMASDAAIAVCNSGVSFGLIFTPQPQTLISPA